MTLMTISIGFSTWFPFTSTACALSCKNYQKNVRICTTYKHKQMPLTVALNYRPDNFSSMYFICHCFPILSNLKTCMIMELLFRQQKKKKKKPILSLHTFFFDLLRIVLNHTILINTNATVKYNSVFNNHCWKTLSKNTRIYI